jgi:2-phospho-L-lactate guanylyltransferase (CobY/MobA/RfbA family)
MSKTTVYSDFLQLVKKHCWMDERYCNIHLMVNDVIKAVQKWVEEIVKDGDDKNITSEDYLNELLIEDQELNTEVQKIVYGVNKKMYKELDDNDMLTTNDRDLELNETLSHVIYKQYFKQN